MSVIDVIKREIEAVKYEITNLLDIDGRRQMRADLDMNSNSILNADITSPTITSPTITPSTIGASIYQSAAQSIPNTTYTDLLYNSEEYDDDGWHSTVSNTARITVDADGEYRIFGHAQYAANAVGIRLLVPQNNGVNIPGCANGKDAASSGSTFIIVSTRPVELSANDYITLQAYQSSGGNLNCTSYFSVIKMR